MFDAKTRNHVLSLLAQGLTVSAASRRTGVSRWAISEWQRRADQGRPLHSSTATPCPRCELPSSAAPEPSDRYAYLLGLYLGDGCISPVSSPRKRVWALRVFCADVYPGLRDECVDAIRAMRPDNRIRLLPLNGCTEVNSHSKHWPCLFPQHGPGKKHTRPIVLEAWQQGIVEKFTKEFVRGLIHSDGSRSTNRVRRTLSGGGPLVRIPALFLHQ